tara:strand:- start:1191 stop:1475 length:285 start_codon:yes stop_codon:yes gene_type:complete
LTLNNLGIILGYINKSMEIEMQFNINGVIKFQNEKDFISYCENKGFKYLGKEMGTHLREELFLKPKFSELSGPCYDGENSIRYETWDIQEVLSR